MLTPPEQPAPSRRFARVARDSLLFATGPAIGKAMAIVTLPVLTRTLGPSAFGQLDILSTLVSVAISVLLLGIDAAAIRLDADHGDADRAEHFATWFVLASMIVLPFGVALFILRDVLSNAFFGSTDLAGAFGLAAIAIVAGTYQYLTSTVLQLQRRPLAYAYVVGGTLVVNGVLAVVFVLSARSVTSVMLAMSASLCVGTIVGALLARADLGARPTRRAARSLLRMGLPLAPAATLIWVGEFVNRFVVLRVSGASQVGFLSVGLRFASIGALAVTGFQLSWQPHAYSISTQPTGLRRVADEGRYVIACVATTIVVIGVVAPELVRVVSGTAFSGAVPVVGGCLGAVLGSAVLLVAVMPCAIDRNMRRVGVATGIAPVVAMLGVLVLAPSHGAVGAAVALTLGQFTGAAIAVALGRSSTLKFRWNRTIVVCAAALVVVFAATSESALSSVGGRVALFLGFVAVLAFEGSLSVGVRLLRQQLWRSRRDQVRDR